METLSQQPTPDFDPPPVTPYEEVLCAGLLRLRYYGAAEPHSPPALLVYPLVKRPFLLDLDAERSVVADLLRLGLSVYVTDWEPPSCGDAWRGVDAYAGHDLGAAVACIAQRERVERVSLVGCCMGGVLALMHAAAHPETVERLVTLALPADVCLPVPAPVIRYMTSVYYNLPAWCVGAGLNERVPHRSYVPRFLADELGEPELVEATPHAQALARAFETWVRSDVAIAGRLAEELAGGMRLESEGILRVGACTVHLDAVRAPVLNIAGERDHVAPGAASQDLIHRLVHAPHAHATFPVGHIGLFLSRVAHERLWPLVGEWLHPHVHREERRAA